MRHTRDTNELLEVAGHELGTVIRDDPLTRLGIQLARPLKDHFPIGLFHLLANFPVDDP